MNAERPKSRHLLLAAALALATLPVGPVYSAGLGGGACHREPQKAARALGRKKQRWVTGWGGEAR